MKHILFFIVFVALLNTGFANPINQQLDLRMQETNSLVCVGLDPDLTKMPESFKDNGKSVGLNVFNFLSEVVEITAPHACCYKIQKAFFDQLEEGHTVLRQICSYIHLIYPGIPVFIDCKIGDIDNTMQAYMNLIFKDIRADGVVVNPYMGDDVLEPFLNDPNKVAIVLIQTSNPNAKVIQELVLKNDKLLWEEMLELTLTRWNQNKNIILVLSSNSQNDYSLIREQIPQDMPILLAGVGSQGGNPKIMKQLLNQDNRGVFINSSRGILYPYTPNCENWRAEILRAVVEFKDMLNHIRQDEECHV